MKKKLITFCLAVLLLASFMSCDLLIPVTEEDAAEAFGIAFGSYLVNVLLYAFGGSAGLEAGVTYNDTTGVMTFDGYDVTGFDAQYDYETMSGTIGTGPNDELDGDVELTGGRVKTLLFTTEPSAADPTILQVTITANGRDFVLTDYSTN